MSGVLRVGAPVRIDGRPDLSGRLTGIKMRDGAEPGAVRHADWRAVEALTVLTPGHGFQRVALHGPIRPAAS